MKIQGKRGKKGKGYSLKDPNKSGQYYVYVWFGWDADKSKEARKAKGKNYSFVKETKNLGRADDPATWIELEKHLLEQYGTFEEQEIRRAVEDEIELKEKKRIAKEKEDYRKLMDLIIEILNKRNIKLKEIPATKKEAQKLLDQMLSNKIV